MALERWIEEQQARGNTPAVEIARTLQRLYGDVTLNGQTPLEVSRQDAVAAEFKAGRLNTPEVVTKGWQTRWTAWGEKIGLNIVVPEFPDTPEGLVEALKRGDKPIYVPAEVSTQESRHLLGKIWPAMQSHAVEERNAVTNEVDHNGWRYTESAVDAPNLNTIEEQLRGNFRKSGREGLTVTEYIIASHDTKDSEGKYFDQGNTYSRLLGSRREGYVVSAHFAPDGDLSVHWRLGPESRYPYIGGRSSQGVAKA